ncbi:MAG TPA: FtsX-like permease family protein [Ktedonobacteraceae bacterium]|nr:FtsX-like permease family protein [Ktedonobacteraceae bacterium]
MKALTKKVFKDIGHRKLRTILTILGIALGILGLSAINIASNQFRSSFDYSTNITTQPDIIFYTSPASASLAQTLQQQPNVKIAQAQGYINTTWNADALQLPLRIIGVVDFQHVQINKFELVEGSLPGPDQILLEYSDKALSNVSVGSQIAVQVGGSYRNLSVSGFARTMGLASASIVQRAQGYMNESDVESLFSTPGVTSFLIRLNNYDQRDATAKQLAQVLNEQHVLVFATYVGRDTSVSSVADGLFAIMNVLSIIAILLSVCLLLGTVMTLVTEQIPYIGTMKAIGATSGKVMRHYLGLVAIYSGIGTLIGLAIGTFGGYALANYLGSLVGLDMGPLQITPSLIIESVLIGIGIPLLAAAMPAYIGTRISVRQALSGYGVENGAGQTGGWWATLSRRVLGMLPQTMQFGARGLFRKRVRTVLTLLILTISAAAFLAVQTASYSFNTFLDQISSTYHFDVLAATADPHPFSTFQHVLSTVPGITQIEPLTQDQVSTQWGNAALTGLQIDTRLYQKQLAAGRWFTGSDENVAIISQDAATKSGLKVGDSITISINSASATWRIIGIATDFSGIGPGNLGVVIAPIAQIDAFMHLPSDYSEFAMIASSNHSTAAVDALANRVTTTMSAAGLQPNVTTSNQFVQQSKSTFQIIYTLLDVVALIVAIVGAIGLANTLAMSVLERRREIGILRSMGATGRKVAQVFWTEGTALGGLSWLLALLIGIPAAYGFVQVQAHYLAPVPFSFNFLNLVWMLVIIVLIASLASIGPVFSAARVKIAQTLRYE